ncbi:trehalose operon repressor TreR [Photobacterium damselae]|uniref:trehalose operon repressor TreR n=1 Tax=Photobacterium damselae TaxID=38293 RepID=UPI002542E053
MTKKLTILDIARLAGVGKSTVSRVLTNDPNVKAKTREKVEQVIKESGFIPSKSAQSMRGGSSKVIGIILSRLSSPSENRAVSGILDVLYGAGYDAVIMESQFDRLKTNEHLAVLRKRRVDGVIVFGFTDCDINTLEQWGHQAVVIAIETQAISSVGYDNHAMIEQLMEHLYQKQCQNISFIGVSPQDKTTGEMRLQAYLDYCHSHSIEPYFSTGKLTVDSGYALVDEVLQPTTQAIVCASDTLAMGAAKRLQQLGRDDIMVTGVGATELLTFLFSNTVSIDPGYCEAGKAAASQLLTQLLGNEQVVHFTQPVRWSC